MFAGLGYAIVLWGEDISGAVEAAGYSYGLLLDIRLRRPTVINNR